MWMTNLRVALRVLRRHRTVSAINVVGLSAALSVCVLALLFVRRETSYDAWQERGDRIWAVYGESTAAEPSNPFRRSMHLPPAMGAAIRAGYAGQRRAVRMQSGSATLVTDRGTFDEQLLATDPEFLELFSMRLAAGDPATALHDPEGVVLTHRTAARYFGDGEAVGRRLRLRCTRMDYSTSPPTEYAIEEERRVTGVLAPLPGPSILRFRMLVPYEAAQRLEFRGMSGVFVELEDGVESTAMEAHLADLAGRHDPGGRRVWKLLPLGGAHFAEPIVGPVGIGRGRIEHLYLLGGVAAMILVIACVNFVNLSIGRALPRAREIGVRKAAGARRGQLAGQFLAEAILVALAAVVGGAVLARIMLPAFNEVARQSLELQLSAESVAVAAVLTLVVGVLSGLYPALFTSRLDPVGALAGRADRGGRGDLGRGLVVLQFALSALLAVVTLTLGRQLGYMRTRDLGFDGDQVMVVGIDGGADDDVVARLAAEVESTRGLVTSVAGVDAAPGLGGMGPTALISGRDSLRAKPFAVSPGFVPTLGLRLVAGRDFEPQRDAGAVILNATAARWLGGAEAAIGRTLTVGRARQPATVIGVVDDFHFEDMRQGLGPAVVVLESGTLGRGMGDRYWHLLFRLDRDDLPAAVGELKALWRRVLPQRPMQYPRFLDQVFASRYEVEQRVGVVMGWLTLVALAISCMGLFGLAHLAAARRTREVGIRKALGATVAGILGGTWREFVVLVLAGNAIAAPLAYLAVDRWLRRYAYRIDPGIEWFALVAAGMTLLALATVGGHTWRAARADPVEALRYE